MTILTVFGAIFGGLAGLSLALVAGLATPHIMAAYPAGGLLVALAVLVLGQFRSDAETRSA